MEPVVSAGASSVKGLLSGFLASAVLLCPKLGRRLEKKLDFSGRLALLVTWPGVILPVATSSVFGEFEEDEELQSEPKGILIDPQPLKIIHNPPMAANRVLPKTTDCKTVLRKGILIQ